MRKSFGRNKNKFFCIVNTWKPAIISKNFHNYKIATSSQSVCFLITSSIFFSFFNYTEWKPPETKMGTKQERKWKQAEKQCFSITAEKSNWYIYKITFFVIQLQSVIERNIPLHYSKRLPSKSRSFYFHNLRCWKMWQNCPMILLIID